MGGCDAESATAVASSRPDGIGSTVIKLTNWGHIETPWFSVSQGDRVVIAMTSLYYDTAAARSLRASLLYEDGQSVELGRTDAANSRVSAWVDDVMTGRAPAAGRARIRLRTLGSITRVGSMSVSKIS